jgi:hypothetical protein
MIPDILWQSWKTKDVPKSVKTQADSWNISNPQLQKRFMDDTECSSFILEHFGQSVHELYLQLPQPIMRADFWRVAVVYVHGGYYSDLDITCKVKIKDLIPGKPEAVFVQELDNISNFFFGAEPGHPVLKAALDRMISEAARITDKETQSFGMHSLHSSVREHYQTVGTNYANTDSVYFIKNERMRQEGKFVHTCASVLNQSSDYDSWRTSVATMNQEREQASNILFFTTFNKNGYELYGKEWIKSFSTLANYYNKFYAKIFYEGFVPRESHPNITWVRYEDAVPHHPEWKKQYLDQTQHSDYVRTMTVRFSHKAFVIQHVLSTESHDYMIWVDGDCVFKNTHYGDFPKSLLGDRFLACQVEHAQDLNHVESGILIFKGNHPDVAKFNEQFKQCYKVENTLNMGEPYDGFLIFKSLLNSRLTYVDLNNGYGRGGIQSDPSMTFCHPEIRSKFIHNIGWTGKNQYANWESIYRRDSTYQKMNHMLFGNSTGERLVKKKQAHDKLQRLKNLKK